MNAFIQKNDTGEWLNENCYFSAMGFYRMGYEIIPFTFNDVHTLKLDVDDVPHGGILAIRKLIDSLGLIQPEIHNPHQYLFKYTNRIFKEKKFHEIVKKYMDGCSVPIFIKPLTNHKLFTGFVVKSFSDLIKISNIDDNAEILQSSVVNFVSEYRCFIHRKKLVGAKNYTGDFRLIPDFDFIESAIQDYIEQPIACSLDFGITDTGETQLIEINDGFALGAYGLNPILYCKMIKDRWNEIMKN